MTTSSDKRTYPADEVTSGVGLPANRTGAEPVARAQRGVGAGIVGLSAVLFVLGGILLMFGLVPVAVLILALIPVAWGGAKLRRRGEENLEELGSS